MIIHLSFLHCICTLGVFIEVKVFFSPIKSKLFLNVLFGVVFLRFIEIFKLKLNKNEKIRVESNPQFVTFTVSNSKAFKEGLFKPA